MTTTSEAVMGFEDETAELIQRLVRGPKHLDVVSLVGMPGIGKTTLAKRLYTHNDIIDRFDVCSWCTISQVYNKRKTLLELLGNLVPPNDNTRSNNELAVELRRHLLRKKYFIVIDDLWSAEVWDDLKSCFPDDYSCSRIILTTRLDKVASYTEVFSAPHHVRLFTGEESWCLLQKKVFGEESCAPQLEKIGVKIAQSCGGLPLAIILVAGVLAKLNNEEIRWEEVANGVRSCTAGDTQKYMDIIDLSFRYLPSQLKRCFLHFGRFCGDEFLVRELIQLWVAEEYAVGNELKSAEDEAKGYVMELIENNLVMIVQRSFFGEVKAIRMHDLLREFCLSRVDFLRSFLTRSDDSSSGDSPYYLQMNYLLHPERGSDSLRSGSPPGPHSAHLLPSDNILNQNIILVYDCNHLSHDDYYKSLRILDLSCITLRSTSPIQALINLRYLALKGNFEADPSWLSELKSLETVILKESRRLNLSHAIWGMVSLKHLEVTGKPAVIRCNVAEFETYPPLKKLQWLSFAHLPGGEEFQQFVSKVPNLVKLRCLVEEPQGDRTCIWLPGLESLNKLESLKVYFLKRSVRRFEVNFPMNLKKLTLSSCQLPWSEISIIGNLENLEVLKLESNAFEGEQWDVKDEEFQNLKLLTFYNMNVPSWNFSDMSFPNLQRVIFKNSRLKTNIPRSFGDLLLLQMIELSWCKCSRRTINSAEEIKKAQIEDMGNHEFKLIIKSREEDEEELRLMWQVDSDLRNWKFHFCFLLLLFLIIFQQFFEFLKK